MEEHNYFFRVRYGFSESLYETEWNLVVTDSLNDEDRIVESVREFIRHVKKENNLG